jgi:hypothetical protein
MKKLIGKLVLLFLFMFSFSKADARTCQECDACTGMYFICDSDNETFWGDVNSNCGPGTSIQIEFLEGC